MHGMIHQAARAMALDRLGEAEWDALTCATGLSGKNFIGVDYYSDAETFALVKVIARRLDLPLNQAFFEFGRHWIEFVAVSAFARALRMAGDDLQSFLSNLDRMHASIKSNIPRASIPSFQVITASPEAIELCYRSEREGLAPFVHGILWAVARRFGETVEIAYAPSTGGVLFTIRRIATDA